MALKGSSIIAALCLVLVVAALFLRERWTTPSDEARAVLRYYSVLEEAEREYRHDHSRYGNLQELLHDGRMENLGQLGCQDGYCFMVTAGENTFEIRVIPDRSDERHRFRRMSLFADQTGTVRVAYGTPFADSNSTVLSSTELNKLGKR